jgi:uncharacterized protein (TIGR02996 family)
MTEDDFLRAIAADPGSAATTWLVLADWLEENGQAERAELVRLQHAGFQPAFRPAKPDARIRELLAAGVQPVVPSLVNSIGMRFVLVPAGTFVMGSPNHEVGRSKDEGPQHEVEISRPFWMGAFPVTQEECKQVMGSQPSWFEKRGGGSAKVRGLDTSRFPVECMSWQHADAFCQRLSALPAERIAGRVYRLPTEAEWEYACRAGTTTPFYFGRSLCSAQANFSGRHPYGGAAKGPYLQRTTAVGSYPPNSWGLYDMLGNVWEWCADWYGAYHPGRRRNPRGPRRGPWRMLRGGAWNTYAVGCRAACRPFVRPRERGYDLGFRVCFHPD